MIKVAKNTAPISKPEKTKSIGRPMRRLMKTAAGATQQGDLRRRTNGDLEGHVDLVAHGEEHRRCVLGGVADDRDQDETDQDR